MHEKRPLPNLDIQNKRKSLQYVIDNVRQTFYLHVDRVHIWAKEQWIYPLQTFTFENMKFRLGAC